MTGFLIETSDKIINTLNGENQMYKTFSGDTEAYYLITNSFNCSSVCACAFSHLTMFYHYFKMIWRNRV